MQRRQLGTHIIHLWPDNALKVVGQNQIPANTWTHVAVTYDGSGKAAGVKVYYDGQEQPVNVEADQLADTIRTDSAAEDRTARHRVSAERRRAAGPAHLPTACSAQQKSPRSPVSARSCICSRKRPQARTADETQQLYRLVAGGHRPDLPAALRRAGATAAGAGGHSGSRHRRARVAGTRRARDGATCSFAENTTSAATR